ncbi:MAG: hypothetical protein K2H45_00400 [Acetatifactor sp.]|nr:hypothetical protein [Acetatifactor sp.]
MENDQLLQALSDMMDQKLQPINNRLDKLESEVSAMKSIQLEMHKKLSETHQLALDAWGTSFENRTWLENPKKFG